MALIKCSECGSEYSSQAKSCVQCGAPTPEDDITYWINLIQKGIWIVVAFFILKALVPFFKPYIHFDGITQSDLTCSSSNLNDQMKSTFDGSQYALSNNLKAILAVSQDAPKKADNSLVTCQTKLTLNNNQTMTYLFDITKNPSGGENSGYLISATPVDQTTVPDEDQPTTSGDQSSTSDQTVASAADQAASSTDQTAITAAQNATPSNQ